MYISTEMSREAFDNLIETLVTTHGLDKDAARGVAIYIKRRVDDNKFQVVSREKREDIDMKELTIALYLPWMDRMAYVTVLESLCEERRYAVESLHPNTKRGNQTLAQWNNDFKTLRGIINRKSNREAK